MQAYFLKCCHCLTTVLKLLEIQLEEESMYPDNEEGKGWEFLCVLQRLST